MRRRLDSPDAMLLVANVLWALSYAITKRAYDAWEPLAFSSTRFAFAGLLFASLILWREGSLRVSRADIPLVVAAASVGILLNQLTFTYAVDNTTAGNVALILGSAPAFAALFAMLAGHEHVGGRHWLALGVSVAGVALVVEGGAGVKGAGYLGNLLAVGAAITWAGYSVLLRPLFVRYSASRISALMIVVGAGMLFPFAAPQIVSQDWSAIGPYDASAWLYTALGPLLLTNLLYFRSLRRIGASRATLYMYLQPFLAVIFAAILIGEDVTLVQVVGGIVIIVGVSLGRLMPGATVRE
jgi:drug/metabolite transporter (DMT)-like permease